MYGARNQDGSWLAAAGEIRELHQDAASAKRPSDGLAPPPPPPPHPKLDEVERLAAALLDCGVLQAACDVASGRTYFYHSASRRATWRLDCYVEANYHDLLPLVHRAPNLKAKTEEQEVKEHVNTRRSAQRRAAPHHADPANASPRGLTAAQWRERVVDLYRHHDPSKVSLVDELLLRYRGNESELWHHLQAKYVLSQPVSASKTQQQRVTLRTESSPSPSTKSAVQNSTRALAGRSPRQRAEKATNSSSPRGSINSPRTPQPDAVAREDPNVLDAYMHQHHGDTHSVSYHTPSPTRSPPHPADLQPPSPIRMSVPLDGADPDIESPQRTLRDEPVIADVRPRQTNHQREQRYPSSASQKGPVAVPVPSVVATPDVSDILEGSQAEEVLQWQRDAFAQVRAAAEAKAKSVLASAAAERAQRSPPDSNRSSARCQKTTSLWATELSRREEELASRRAAVVQERQRAKQRKDEEMQRRAQDLQRMREADAALRQELLSTGTDTTPHRSSDRPGSPRAGLSPRPLLPSDQSPSCEGNAISVTTVRSPSPTKVYRKLSVSEQRSSVERLYRVAAK